MPFFCLMVFLTLHCQDDIMMLYSYFIMGLYDTPLPKETITFMFDQWLSVIQRRECASILSLPRFDRHYRVAQFIGMVDEESSKAVHYTPVLFQSFATEVWDEFVQKLNSLRHPTKYTVFFVLDAEWLLTAAPHMVSHLQEYILRPYRNVSFVFFFERNLTHPIYSELTRQCPALLQNVITQSLYSQEAIDHFIQHMGMMYGVTYSKADRERVWAMCGGYIWLTTEAIRNLHKCRALTFDHPEMKMRLKAIWDGFSNEEQGILRTIVRNQKVEDERRHYLDYFQQTQLISEVQGKLRIVVPILAEYIQANDMGDLVLRLDEAGEIFSGATRVTAIFTKKQQDLIRYLLAHNKEILSREAAARLLWGEAYEEKYSDWGLDQAMKRIRSKISSLGGGPLIRTVKGRGYMYR